MKIQTGPFEFSYNKERPDMSTQDSNIRSMPKRDDQPKDVDNDRVVNGAKVIIQTYFMWKMADRILEKVLR